MTAGRANTLRGWPCQALLEGVLDVSRNGKMAGWCVVALCFLMAHLARPVRLNQRSGPLPFLAAGLAVEHRRSPVQEALGGSPRAQEVPGHCPGRSRRSWGLPGGPKQKGRRILPLGPFVSDGRTLPCRCRRWISRRTRTDHEAAGSCLGPRRPHRGRHA